METPSEFMEFHPGTQKCCSDELVPPQVPKRIAMEPPRLVMQGIAYRWAVHMLGGTPKSLVLHGAHMKIGIFNFLANTGNLPRYSEVL